MTPPDTCPLCGADLTSEPIPERHRKFYDGRTHYTRRIGLYAGLIERITEWQCPDCNGTWPREAQE